MFKIIRHPNFRRLAFAAFFLILLGALLFMFLEDWSFIDALYFTVTTILTVGYGDLHVTNTLSKIIAIIYMLLAVPFVLGFIELMAELVHDRILEDAKRK